MRNSATTAGSNDQPDDVVDWEALGRRVRLAAEEAAEQWLPLEEFMRADSEASNVEHDVARFAAE